MTQIRSFILEKFKNFFFSEFMLGSTVGFLICIVIALFHYYQVIDDFQNLNLIIGDINSSISLSTTLDELIRENKLFSPKDLFGMYASYYNNLVIILVAMLGAFYIISFVYIKNKTENEMNMQVEKYLNNKENMSNIFNIAFGDKLNKFLPDTKTDIDFLKSKLSELETKVSELDENIDTEAIKNDINSKT